MTTARTSHGMAYEHLQGGRRRLLLLHGLGGDRHQPLALLDEHLRARYEVVAPDLRAHGASGLPITADTLTFATLAADVLDLLSDLPPNDDLTVLGISMGAAVAAHLLATTTLPMSRLVLVRPAWAWQPSPPNLAVFPAIADLLDSAGPAAGRAAFAAGPQYAAIAMVCPAAAAALAAQFDAPHAVQRAARLRALPADAPAFPAARSVPTLVMGSDLDPVHPMSIAEQVAGDLAAEVSTVAPRYQEPSKHTRQVRERLHAFTPET